MLDPGQYIGLFRKIIGADEPEEEPISQMEIENAKRMLNGDSNLRIMEKPFDTTHQRDFTLGNFVNRIYVSSPKTLEDCNQILEQLRNPIAIVINFESEELSRATQILNYLCGGIYVLRGKAVRLSSNIIVFLGEGVEYQ